MPANRKCVPFCLPHNQIALVGVNKNSPCDGYFGCDDELLEDDKKALINRDDNPKNQYGHQLPWTRRKSPPVLSFFKRVASLRKHDTVKEGRIYNGHVYRTLPNPKTTDFYTDYKCCPYNGGFTSLKKNYCCDGYFGCPPTK